VNFFLKHSGGSNKKKWLLVLERPMKTWRGKLETGRRDYHKLAVTQKTIEKDITFTNFEKFLVLDMALTEYNVQFFKLVVQKYCILYYYRFSNTWNVSKTVTSFSCSEALELGCELSKIHAKQLIKLMCVTSALSCIMHAYSDVVRIRFWLQGHRCRTSRKNFKITHNGPLLKC